MADLYNPLAGVRGTGRTYNDLLASRPGTRDAFAQQLMQMLQGLKPTTYTYRGANPDANSVEPSQAEVDLTGYRADILDQLFGGADKGGYTLNPILEAQPSYGYTFSTGQLRDPYQSNNHVGRWNGKVDANGNLSGLRWENDSTTSNFVDRTMGLANDLGPLLVLAAATAGAGGFAGLGGLGAEGAAGGAAGGSGLTIGAGGQTGVTLGAGGVTGATAPAGFVLAPEIGTSLGAAGGVAAADAASGGGGYFGGLDPAAGGQGLQMPGATNLPSMGGGQGLAASQSALAPQLGSVAGTSGFGAGIADMAKTAAGLVKDYGSLAGPAMSLISGGAQLGRLPQVPGAPVIPGAEAPPEARGYQPASAPILDVLGRNRRAGRNQTLLTGPRGVNMDSVRVGGNTLLGL